MEVFIGSQYSAAATLAFISRHADADVSRLALNHHGEAGVDMPFALNQIAGLQTARTKLPLWAACDGIVYPSRLAMEQCSSQFTAQYKSALVVGDSLLDLTGGLGVDFSFMSRRVARATYVEQNETLCRAAQHNFAALGLTHVEVCHTTAEQYLLQHHETVDTIYLDPARRNASGGRTYAIADCTPDVSALAPTLLERSRRVLVKLSPMLDVTAVVRQLPAVTELHIVSVDNECKELLAVMERGGAAGVTVVCADDDHRMSYTLGEPCPQPDEWDGEIRETTYLYVPNASLMKAGCYAELAQRYGLCVVSRDSHLMVSDSRIDDYPGRCFVIEAVTSLNKQALRTALQGIERANVAVRNFPMKAPELARRLHLRDGGENYIFGTRLANGKNIILLCRK